MKKRFLIFGIVLVLILLFWQIFLRDLKVTGSAKLSWNPSNESDIIKYNVYYGKTKRANNCPGGGYEKKVDAGKEPLYEIENLENNQTYYFSVTSVNSSGKESCFSEEMSKTIKISFFDKLKSIFFKK